MPLSRKKKLSLYTSLIISSTTLAGCLPDISFSSSNFSSSNNRGATTRVESFVPETSSTTDTSAETSEKTSEAQNSQESTTPTQNDIEPSSTPKNEESSSSAERTPDTPVTSDKESEKSQEQQSSAATSQAQEPGSGNTSQAVVPVDPSASSEASVSSTSTTSVADKDSEKSQEQQSSAAATSQAQEPNSGNTSQAVVPVDPSASSEASVSSTSTTSVADKESEKSEEQQNSATSQTNTPVDPATSTAPSTTAADTSAAPTQEETLDEEDTKIELNYIDSVALYQSQSGTSTLVEKLDSAPADASNFYVVINNKLSKPIYVNVKKFEQVNYNNQQVIKAQLDLAGLIHRANSSVIEDDFVYIPMSSGGENLNKRTLDLSNLPGYQLDNAIAYENMIRLLPFYNREKIIQYGNKVSPSDPLYTQRITSVIPMADDQFVIDVSAQEASINKLFVLFEDDSYQIYDLSGKESSAANNSIVEYKLSNNGQNDGLIYTPNTFITNNSEIIDKVVSTFKAIDYNSPEIAKAMDDEGNFGQPVFDTRLKRFYLEDGFNSVKDDIEKNLSKILAADGVLTTSDPEINQQYIKKLKDNAAEIMLALSYLQRWYDINFDSYNIRDITTFKFGFWGSENISTLDALISIGKDDWGRIFPSENTKYYKESLSKYTNSDDLFGYLERYRKIFLPEKTNNKWLVDNSKAYIVEKLSTVEEAANQQKVAGTDTSIGVYDRIKNGENKKYQHMLLPLLTLRDENMYVIATMGALSMGGYEPYYTDLTESNRQLVRALVDETAEKQRNVFDFWYKILNENDRKNVFQNMLNYDTFKIGGVWQNLYANYGSIQQFFGPVDISSAYNDASAHALSSRKQSFFFEERVLGDEGTSTFSHEMVHLFDENIYLSTYGRRPGMGPEAYAEGLFETTYTTSDYIGFNQAYVEDSNNLNRYHNADPTLRFQNEEDLKEYMSGMFDVVYLMEYLEGQAMVDQSSTVKRTLLRKVENDYTGNHAINTVKTLSTEEINKLQTFDDLVQSNVITTRKHTPSRVNRNAYNVSYYSASNWAALSNDKGAPGGIMFKRMAMELLAEKGYYNGMLPYISNMLQESTSSNSGLVSYNVTDQKVLNHVFKEDDYKTWSDFKLAMYKERADKAKKYLRPVTIQYNPENLYGTDTVTIKDFNDLKDYFDKAVQKDAQRLNFSSRAEQSYVAKLKEAVYKAYLVDTNEFRDSIFGDSANG